MAMKNVLYLRILSLIANTLYVIYGIFLNALPFIIGCTIAVLLHAFHIRKLYAEKKLTSSGVESSSLN